MDNKQSHIDQIIKEKLDQFQPAPPVEVWAGIEKAMAAQEKPAFFLLYQKQIALSAAVLVALLLTLWYFTPETLTDQNQDIILENTTVQSETEVVVNPVDNQEFEITQTEAIGAVVDNNEESSRNAEVELNEHNSTTTKTSEKEKSGTDQNSSTTKANLDTHNLIKSSPEMDFQLNYLETRMLSDELVIALLATENQDDNISGIQYSDTRSTFAISNTNTANELPEFKNYWNIALYFTPEMTLNNIDSVTFMTTYSVNIEPFWYFSKHWFMRFGAGASYIRDHGYAKVDYLSNDFQGAYDSVYNVTFDTIDNIAYPVYHTKEVEIWDTIQHLNVSEVTNSYYYIQLPLLFGYHNSTKKFKWYFYGGPAVNISIAQQFQDPKSTIDYTEIIHLENDLPQRTNYSMQLWVGAGIDFRVGKRFSVALEPNYRYYFEPTYQENNYKTALSGLGLRFGLVYKFIE